MIHQKKNNLFAEKHVEAKKFYVLYNQLDDTRIQLEKEYNLLTSVLDSFALWVFVFVCVLHHMLLWEKKWAWSFIFESEWR